MPPRFALALTLVANGATVNGRPVATMELRDPSFELLLEIHMLYGLDGQDEASFCIHNSAVIRGLSLSNSC